MVALAFTYRMDLQNDPDHAKQIQEHITLASRLLEKLKESCGRAPVRTNTRPIRFSAERSVAIRQMESVIQALKDDLENLRKQDVWLDAFRDRKL